MTDVDFMVEMRLASLLIDLAARLAAPGVSTYVERVSEAMKLPTHTQICAALRAAREELVP